jgi:preprotein translocase subunit SecF
MSAVGRRLVARTNIDFQVWWRRGIVLSVVLLVVSIGALGFRGLNLGVEFTGGVAVSAPASDVSIDEVRSALTEGGVSSARPQLITDSSGGQTVRVQASADDDETEATLRAIVASVAGVDASEVSVTAVSASWGQDVTRQAIRALLFFLAAILIYLTIRLEFRMAVGAIVATVHDILITVGIYALFQFEVSPGTVVAFLMVLGYSIYDTVVIYDKVKEGEPLVGISNRLSYSEMASRSMNLVLVRSINTSITSLLPVLSLLVVGSWLLGAVTLNQFALPLAVGLVVGTYSSIMVATPVVVWLKEREPRYRQLRERLAASAGETAGAPVGAAREVTAAGAEPGSDSPTQSRRSAGGAADRSAPSGAIPPRPRKKSGKPRKR